MKEKELLTDEQIDNVFANANFGNVSKRDVIKYSLLKYACGYSTGYTAFCILKELGLITKNENLTTLGKQYLWDAFFDGYSF